MSDQTSLTQDEQQIETLLGALHPMRHGTQRDRLLFQAGRASAGHVRMWQGVSGVCAVLLLCSLVIRTETLPVRSEQSTPQWAAPTVQSVLDPVQVSHADLDNQAYIRVRSRVLQQGLDALPDMKRSQSQASALQYGDALKWMINM